jgi:uncharacterized protein YegJ (DUF2314 family)
MNDLRIAQQLHAAIWITIKCTRPTATPVCASAIVRHTSGAQSLMRDVRRHPCRRARLNILEEIVKFVILFVALMSPAALSQEKSEDQIVNISSEDKEMNAAIRHARDTLDQFLEVLAKPPKGTSGFKVKVQVTDSGGVEHLWVTPFRQTWNGFEGTIANEPRLVHSVKYGQRYRFDRSAITDWGYELNGKQKGSFTICVLFKHMPADEVQTYRKDYGFEC